MSRIGKKIISVPAGVQVKVEQARVRVNGPKGSLEIPVPGEIRVEVEGSTASVMRTGENPRVRALHGLTRALLANAVTGVNTGFIRKLDVVGIGYRAEVRGKWLNLSLGHSHPVEFPVPSGLEISVEREPRTISNYVATIKIGGADKGRVGQAAADIRSLRPPDPYKGKGVRYSDEVVRTKVGKKGA